MVKQILLYSMWVLFFISCAAKQPIRTNPTGPTITEKSVPVFLESALNTAVEEGPVSFKVAAPINLSDGTKIPQGSILDGYFVTGGNKVEFAPSVIRVKKDNFEQSYPVNSMQSGRLAVTPTTARYMKEMGKGAAIGGTVGALGGALVGAKYGVGGVIVGAIAGAAAGGAIGAGSQAMGLWLKGDEPVSLPVGSGMVVGFEKE